MRNLKKVLALVLAFCMVFALAACGKKEEPAAAEPVAAEPAPAEPAAAPAEEVKAGIDGPDFENGTVAGTTAVYATSTFGQKFSPFFHTVVYDQEVCDLITGYLVLGDRGGAVLQNSIEGETVNYNGTDYTYYNLGNVEVTENSDGSVDYKLTMRNDVLFSDGEPATIDDVIFGIYVLCDPTYDGSSTLYAVPIEGMEEYRSGMDSLFNLLVAAGEDNTDFTNWDEATQTAFWADLNQAGAAFAQEIIDYVCANYIDYASDIGHTAEEVLADPTLQCQLGMVEWGFGDYYEDGALAPEYFAAICDAYDWDLTSASDTESAGSSLFDLMENFDAYGIGIQTGEGAANITGIQKIDDYTLNIHTTEFDATAIYQMELPVAPLHYYGDVAQYDYDNNMFGFPKGDLSIVKSVTSKPLGCGPYIFEGYANGVATLKANPYYWRGAAPIETMLFQESIDSDYVPGISTGTFDIAMPSLSSDKIAAIKDANSNGELTGDTITTYLVDYRGYGYIGCNADLVNVNGDPSSEESKNLRKAFMTLMAVYRDTVINSYYGDRAAVIQYPISNTSWAAPKPADEGYKLAYSTDADGNQIYTSGMSEEEKYEAARQAAIGYLKGAGFTYDEAAGKFTGVEDSWEILIPGDGIQDHPAYGVAVAASEVLEELGITLQVNDVSSSVWNNALESNTAMFWAAAWQSSVDPDMTQVYHSSNAHGNGTNSNHYSMDDADLDSLIEAGKKSSDTEYRKSVYRDAMDIIMDWGCELPTYQRKDCTTVSTQRIDNSTVPGDLTPYWGWSSEPWALSAVQ